MRITGKVTVIEFPDKILIYKQHQLCAEYPKPPEDVKNKKFPEDRKGHVYGPKNIKKGCDAETVKLVAIDPCIITYLDFINSRECRITQKYKFIRDLYRFSRRMSDDLFIKCIERAIQYRIDTIDDLEGVYVHILGLDQHTSDQFRKKPRKRKAAGSSFDLIPSVEEDLQALRNAIEKTKKPPQG